MYAEKFLLSSMKGIDGLSKHECIKKVTSAYNKDGYDTALLLQKGCNALKNIEFKDSWIPAAIKILDRLLVVNKRESEKRDCLQNAFHYLYRQSGHPPSAKEFWRYLSSRL